MIENIKRCVICRGIPGSGKSTMARWMAAHSGQGEFWKTDSVLYYGKPSLALKVELLSKTGDSVEISGTDYPHKTQIESAIHSTDEYFMVDGVYKYNPSKIGLYHGKNYKAFRDSVDAGIPVVIVDNTNTTEAEYAKYRNYAEDMGYWVSYIVMPHPTLNEALSRNEHNVPADAIQKMIKRFE